MTNNRSLCHTSWDCKYHVVWIPKYRRKVLFGKIRVRLGEVFRELARQRESVVIEGHLCPDHVHSDTAKIRGVASCGLYQGEERDPYRQNIWRPKSEFYW